tara:strand:+ start:180 stop:485 length:306 start_codon:yes stop_codon:yes gene_type:complete
MMNFSFRLIILLFLCSFLGSVSVSAEDNTVVMDATVLRIDINKASSVQLANHLLGIGMIKAAAIVEHRSKHGDFHSIDELTTVQGVGAALVEKNRDKIRFN